MIKVVDVSTGAKVKATPKRKAEEIIMDGLSKTIGYWTEDLVLTEGLTEMEKERVRVQIDKVAQRVARLCHYEAPWIS